LPFQRSAARLLVVRRASRSCGGRRAVLALRGLLRSQRRMARAALLQRGGRSGGGGCAVLALRGQLSSQRRSARLALLERGGGRGGRAGGRAALGRQVGVERAAARLQAVQRSAERAQLSLKRGTVVAPARGARPHAQHLNLYMLSLAAHTPGRQPNVPTLDNLKHVGGSALHDALLSRYEY